MADEAGHVAELLSRLAGFNARVATFQQSMVRHFEAEMDARLENCPDDVSSEVRRVIAASMSNYPALCPRDGGHGIHSPPPDLIDAVETPHGWVGRQSPPPSGVFKDELKDELKDEPHTPHQREKDLAGVFTPGYLPLLGDSHRPQQSSPSSSAPLSPAVSSTTSTLVPKPSTLAPEPLPALSVKEGKQPAKTTPGLPASESASASLTPPSRPTLPSPGAPAAASASLPPPGPPTMPPPIASLTPPGARRSALRRSSSVSLKGASPRQVRFSHEGEEVLPTASPPKSTPMSIPYSLRPMSADGQGAEGEFSDDKAGDELSLWDVEGEEDPVPEKKITTTQMLQALGRMPEEGSHVKEVPGGEAGAPIGYIVSVDGQARTLRAPEPGSDLMAADSTDLTLKKPVGELFERAKSEELDHDIMLASLKPSSKVFRASHDGSLDLRGVSGSSNININPSKTKPSLAYKEEEETSTDDFIEMKRISKSPKSPGYSARGYSVGNGSGKGTADGNASPTGAAPGNAPLKRTTSKGSLLDRQKTASIDSPIKRTSSLGDLAHLQGQSGPSKPKATGSVDADPFFGLGDEEDTQCEDKYLPSDDDADNADDANDEGANDDDDHDDSDDNDDDANDDLHRMTITGTPRKPALMPITSPSAALFTGMAGSYGGSSFNLGPTTNAKLYDEIAGMKDVHSFIGSIDGRTGLDSSDAGSCRAAMTKSIGTHPKSLTEMLALEEATERRASEKEEEVKQVEKPEAH